MITNTLGTYFPSFASIYCPPLWGTRIFPLAADQEKLQFIIANEGPLDRFDGEEDADYIADVKAFMQKMFQGWSVGAQDEDFLQWYTESVEDDFKQKFPFTISRFNERCSMDKEKNQRFNIPKHSLGQSTQRPAQVKHDRGGTTIVSKARVKLTKDPQTSSEDLRVAQVS